MSRHVLKLVSAVGVSLGIGGILGSNYERNIQREREGRLRSVFNIPPVTAARPGSNSGPVVPYDANRASQVMRFGFPGFNNLKTNHNYIVSYDKKNRVPHWVYEHLSKSMLTGSYDRNACEFHPDMSIHPYFRATNEDFYRSGYDRGHLAAAGNYRHSQAVCQETFLLSNIAPQVGDGFNRHAWNDLEKMTRSIVRNYQNVYVCTGPLYLPRKESDGRNYVRYEVIGNNNVAVPTHFFKVLIMETEHNELELLSFVLPNQKLPEKVDLNAFVVPLESIERASGLLFFNQENVPRFKKVNGRRFA